MTPGHHALRIEGFDEENLAAWLDSWAPLDNGLTWAMLRAQFERMGEAAGQTVAAVWAATVRADAAASGWVRPVGAGRARWALAGVGRVRRARQRGWRPVINDSRAIR